MEPRHQETEADRLVEQREAEATNEPGERVGQEDVGIPDDDQRHEASSDEESQLESG